MRHLALVHPRQRRAARRDDQFLFGPDLLAAPVVKPGARRRSAYLPRGRWVDLWRSAEYRRARGGLELRRARMLRGGRTVNLPAPLDELPLLARAGAVLPLLPPDVDTLAGYGSRARLVKLSERRGRMQLLAFPRGRSSARFYRRERLVSRERANGWSLTVRGLAPPAVRPAGGAVHAAAPAAAVPRRAGRPAAGAGRVELQPGRPYVARALQREARDAVGAQLRLSALRLRRCPRWRPRRGPDARLRRTPPRSWRRTRPGHPGCGWTPAPGPPRPPRRPRWPPRCAGRS